MQRCFALGFLALLLSKQASAAEPSVAEPSVAADGEQLAEREPALNEAQPNSGFELGVGGQYSQAFVNVCQSSFDVTACGIGLESAGFLFTPRWRFAESWSLGALTQVGWSSGSSFGNPATKLWRLAAEARWRPLFGRPRSPWLGLDLGTLLFLDVVNSSRLGPRTVYYTWAPALGVTAAVDLMLTSSFTLGIELRGVGFLVGSQDRPPRQRPEYESGLAASLALVGSFIGG